MPDQLTQWARSLFKEISEPGNGRAGETPVTAPRQAGEDTSDPASPAPDFRYRPVTTSVRRRG
jgi:hypothetical protein